MDINGAGFISRYPWMEDGLFACVPLARVHAHQMTDKVLGRLRYVIPIRRIKLVFSFHDLGEEIGIVLLARDNL